MGWMSPRQAHEDARRMGEKRATSAEKQLGRDLTAEEYARIHKEAERQMQTYSANARRHDS